MADDAPLTPLEVLFEDADLTTVELLRYIGRNVQLRAELVSRGRRRAVDRGPERRTDPTFGAGARNGAGSGPELDGFDSDEWRVLTPRPVAPHVYGSWVEDPGPAALTAKDAAAGAMEPPYRPARLMILANYRAFSAPEDLYIQHAIDQLG